MNDVWTSLTVQGKLVLVAVIVLVLALLGLVYEGRGGSDAAPGLASLPTPSPSATSNLGGALGLVTATPSPEGTETTPVATPVSETAEAAATPTPEPGGAAVPSPTSPVQEPPPTQPPAPTQPPPTQPPAPPTATASFSPGCFVTVSSVSGAAGQDPQVAASFVCDGDPVVGSTMNAFFNYESGVSTCDSVSNSAGEASCQASGPGEQAGAVASVTVCFDGGGQVFCNTVN